MHWLRRVLLLVLLGFLTAAGVALATYVAVQVPPPQTSAVAQENTYFYSDGTVLAREGRMARQNVRLAIVPMGVRRAILAAEDRTFYSGGPINITSTLRGAWNTATGKGRQSGSTITQQYVKNYYLSQEQSSIRKLKEMAIAIKLRNVKSRDEILEGYLNVSYFGRRAYGIKAASHAYYGKDVSRLSVAEGAYLAALLNAPSVSDVSSSPHSRERVLRRWNYVLDGMVSEGWLDPVSRAAILFPEPRDADPMTGLSGQRGYLVEAAKDYIFSHGFADRESFAAGGYQVWTTIDRKRQEALVEAVEDQVIRKLDPDKRPQDRLVRVGGASIEPSTGRLVSLYGGIDYTKQYVNNATRRDYSPGSLFKPLVFAAAVDSGARTQSGSAITANTIYDGTSRIPVWTGDGYYTPENNDNISYGLVSAREAMEKSVNSVYVQMAVDVGPAKIREMAVNMGIPEDAEGLVSGPALALGVTQVSVVDMASVYATLARRGETHAWTIIEKITKGDDEAVGLPERDVKRVMSAEAADATTELLAAVIASGTGKAAGSIERPAAGKTGTAEGNHAAWFAGYTRELSTTIAVMGQDPDAGQPKSLHHVMGREKIHGGDHPALTWAAYMKKTLQD